MEEVSNVVKHKIESKLVIWERCEVYGIYKPLRLLVAPKRSEGATAQAFAVYIMSIDSTSCPYNYYLLLITAITIKSVTVTYYFILK